MTREDKQLALQDLCARLPHGVIGEYSWKGNEPYNRELTGSLFDELKSSWDSTEDSEFLPYLRPLSSMIDEEREAFIRIGVEHSLQCIEIDNKFESFVLGVKFHKDEIEYLLERHYDVYGLIPMGLAIEVTKNNNPYKLNYERNRI